jgi:hypothetical protein
VNPSSLKPIDYGSFNRNDIEQALKDAPVFETIKEHDPELYQQILSTMEAQIKNGASMFDLEQGVGSHLVQLAGKALLRTSDKALIKFARESMYVLAVLEKNDPILGLKWLYPKQYGILDITKFLSKEELRPMNDAFALVIVDSYIPNNPKTDIVAAEQLMERIAIQLGDDAHFLKAEGLQNREEYSKACKALSRFYEELLFFDTKTAGNGLRYAFGL